MIEKEETYESVLHKFHGLKKGIPCLPSEELRLMTKALCEEIYELKKAHSKHLSQSHGQANHYGD